MRKVVGTCIYESVWTDEGKAYRIWNFTVTTFNGEVTTFIGYNYNQQKGALPYKYNGFNIMYGALLKILKNNNMYTSVSKEFGRDFYNIQFIEYGNCKVSRYGYNKELDHD